MPREMYDCEELYGRHSHCTHASFGGGQKLDPSTERVVRFDVIEQQCSACENWVPLWTPNKRQVVPAAPSEGGQRA